MPEFFKLNLTENGRFVTPALPDAMNYKTSVSILWMDVLLPAALAGPISATDFVLLEAEAFDGLQPGVVVIESIWPNSAFEGGVGVNALTSADPGPPLGGAVFHDTAVWIRSV